MDASAETRVRKIVERLKEEGGRVTPQRLAIMKVLASSVDHPSAEQIYKKVREDFPTTSLATVYKTIATMKSMGDVLELEFSRGGNRYDGRNPFPHPHVICTECGKVIDPHAVEIDEITRKIMEETGFRIDNHRLDFYGLCPVCQKRKENL